jgi:hypothetical protein
MKQIFENWRKHVTEAAVPHSAHHVVKKMMKTGLSAKEALKSLTHDLSDEEAERWLEHHKDEMDSAKQDIASRNEAAYEPGRAGTFDIDTGEEYLSPEDLMRDEVQDLADKFNVEASVEIASDGKPAILVTHQDGETTVYNDTEEMYQDLADEIGRDMHGDPDRDDDDWGLNEEDKDWIQKAVDPDHEGYCTPMTKSTCTPKRKALAKRFKKAAKKKEKKGGTGWQGKV